MHQLIGLGRRNGNKELVCYFVVVSVGSRALMTVFPGVLFSQAVWMGAGHIHTIRHHDPGVLGAYHRSRRIPASQLSRIGRSLPSTLAHSTHTKMAFLWLLALMRHVLLKVLLWQSYNLSYTPSWGGRGEETKASQCFRDQLVSSHVGP